MAMSGMPFSMKHKPNMLQHSRPRSGSERSIQIEIGGRDRFGQQLDGMPGTVALIDPSSTSWSYWNYYEDRRGGTDTRRGGVDLWHELGTVHDPVLLLIDLHACVFFLQHWLCLLKIDLMPLTGTTGPALLNPNPVMRRGKRR